jgi:hypothetical protein
MIIQRFTCMHRQSWAVETWLLLMSTRNVLGMMKRFGSEAVAGPRVRVCYRVLSAYLSAVGAGRLVTCITPRTV